MYDPSAGSGVDGMLDPPAPPRPVPASLVPSGPRYGYLVARLRNRQITMEEATELFGLLQDALGAAAQAMRTPPAPPASRGVTSRGSAASPSPVRGPPVALRDEDVALGLLALGAGSGLLAAILKRSSEGPRSPGPK